MAVMIEIAGPHPRFEPVGSFSLVDGFGHLVDELVRRDTEQPGHWRLEVYETPPANVLVVGLFLPGQEHSQLTYYSQSLIWEQEITPLRLFVETIDTISEDPRVAGNLNALREAHGSSAEMFRRFLQAMASSVVGRSIDPHELNDMTRRQLVAYSVGLMAYSMSVPRAHAFADRYK